MRDHSDKHWLARRPTGSQVLMALAALGLWVLVFYLALVELSL